MSKKYQKLYMEWDNTALNINFATWLDQRRDDRKSRKVKITHDYTPHPWSEPVPVPGYYFVFHDNLWSRIYLDVGKQPDIKTYTHWMHMPPVPTEVK
jgi:hypothetical protein